MSACTALPNNSWVAYTKPSVQHVVAGSSSSSLRELMNQVPLDFLWCAEAEENTHAIVCRTLKLSVCQWRQWSREVQSDISFLSVGQIEASKFDSPAPRLFFFYWLNRFCHVAMMKKHSKNPFILRISPSKSLCTHLTDRRAFTWSSCQQDLFCREPVNFVDASLVNKRSRPPKRVGESSRGLSADEPVGTWETPFVFSTMKGSQ